VNVNYKVTGVEEVKKFITELPRGVKAAAMRAIVTYIVGDKNHGLKHDVAYRYVSRKRAYPPTGWQSDKQRRYVMWAIKTGHIKIGRKNTPTHYGQSWDWRQKDSKWDRTDITGRLPFDRFPSRHNRLAGWRHYMEVVNTNIKGAIAAGQRAVNDMLKGKK
jgi:hypothetical protein